MKTQTLTLLTLTLLALALLTLPSPAPAQWTNDPWNGMVPVCTAEEEQSHPRIVQLSSGRYLIAWKDERSDPHMIYYQVLNAQGVPLFTPDGLPIILGNWTAAWGSAGTVIPDGEGGCIAVFEDYRNGATDVYGQRFDSLGNRLWGDRGLPLVVWPGPEDVSPKDVVADSLGNFFISCVGGGYNCDIFIQKFQADGALPWGPYGVPVCVGQPNTQEFQESVPDMIGGIIDVWRDSRFGTEELNFFTQHLDADGNPLWAINGIQLFDPVSGNPLEGYLGGGVPDGSGGGVWSYDTFWNWYLFRLSGTGHMEWLDIFSLPDTCYAGPPLRHPEDGSIYVSTYEKRTGQSWGGYLYRFDLAGNPLFGTAGLSLGGIWIPTLSPVSEGVIAVKLVRHGANEALWGTRFNASGTVQWQSVINYWNLYNYNGWECGPDGQDGLVCAWEDGRNLSTSHYDIYAQRLRADGSLGSPMPPYPHAPDWPRFNVSMIGHTVRLTQPETGIIELALYNLLGQRVLTLVQGEHAAGVYDLLLDDKGLTAGIYFLNLNTSQGQQTLKIAIVK